MKSFLVFSTCFLFFATVYGASFSEFIYPNFTASNLQFVEKAGSFLSSRNGTFKLSIYNPGAQQTNFYLCVIHVPSNTIIWSANRDAPISNSGIMNFTGEGITVFDQKGNPKWSTPPLKSLARALLLSETGNLILLDQFNASIWESFYHPTDTIVIGQRLPVRGFLSSSVSNNNLFTGSYSLTITESDAVMTWHGQTYWKLTMETKAYVNSNHAVEYMAINSTGLYLFGQNGSEVIVEVVLSTSNFRIAKLVSSGQFTIKSYSGTVWKEEFVWPGDGCQIPYICGKMGLCTDDATSNTPTCSCPADFHAAPDSRRGCVPSNPSFSFPLACNTSNNDTLLNSSDFFAYMRLGNGIDYFANHFSSPKKYGISLSVCQDFCSRDCSCSGIFHENSSGSCYVIANELGSIKLTSSGEYDYLGYVKVLGPNQTDSDRSHPDEDFPVVIIVLLCLTGFFLLAVLAFYRRRRWIIKRNREIKKNHHPPRSSSDLDVFYIPGLPQRFDYKELEVATNDFKIQIGSGGFGVVFKGSMPDKSVVAVKKIINLGVQGKKEFCTEIAIIGNIHHINLVKLRGFCAQGTQRLLVYEYMNHGSLDCTLFGNGPVLEWQERFDIALGTAHGLAYLHCGCEQKIIHCDIKPENILLHDNFHAKISDFGLSKLLSPEQSGLFTTMRGTRGYLAPEWLTNSAISEKTDVYSFGMVLLELVSGRRNCSTRSRSHSMDANTSSGGHSSTSSVGNRSVYFPLFALEMHEQGRYLELADPRLEGRVTTEEVEKLVLVALCCVHEEPELRPNMATVISMLEGGIPLIQPIMSSLNFLRFYGRRFSEASMIEEENVESDITPIRQAVASHTSTTSESTAYYSYVSSQQISGPR